MVSWGDWFGTDRVAYKNVERETFEIARATVHKLGLTSANEWKELCRSGKLPRDIPAAPNLYYKNKGWINWPDWLGK